MEDKIEIDLRDTVRCVVDLIRLAQDRDHLRAVMNIAMNLLILQNVWKFLSSSVTSRFSRNAQFHGVC
jgi:hypothetical protein